MQDTAQLKKLKIVSLSMTLVQVHIGLLPTIQTNFSIDHHLCDWQPAGLAPLFKWKHLSKSTKLSPGGRKRGRGPKSTRWTVIIQQKSKGKSVIIQQRSKGKSGIIQQRPKGVWVIIQQKNEGELPSFNKETKRFGHHSTKRQRGIMANRTHETH